MKEANLLCGDAITNFKTVQSFGHTADIIALYEKYLTPAYDVSRSLIIKTGLAFGLSQFAQYLVFACMFWAGGYIIENS